ncbi:MAG: extracellular solute-binding protein [Armatimonadetes bacterium]|nr:extracellular solute-binding protein [Armatimonadota bacterium]
MCRLVKEKNKIKYAVAFDKNGYRLPIFFYQNGGSLTNLNYTKSNLNSKEVIESLDWLAKMHKNALGMLDSITGAIDNDDAFVQGLAAFNYGGMWMMNYFDKYQKGNWGATYLPKNKASATCFGGNLLTAYKESKHPQESWELIKFLVEPENLKKFSEKNMFIPARMDLKPDYKNFSKEAQIFINQYKTIPKHFIKENISPAFGDFYIILEEALAQIVTSQKSSHEASKELNNEFNKFLGSK